MIVHDGETVAIGGLITMVDDKNETKIPVLGDLPWVGAAFRYRQQTKTKQELVVLLTPRVTRNHAQRLDIAAGMATKMDWMVPDVTKMFGAEKFQGILPPSLLYPPNGTGAPPEAGPAPRTLPPGGGQQPHLIMPDVQPYQRRPGSRGGSWRPVASV